jgi:hypothetical protein
MSDKTKHISQADFEIDGSSPAPQAMPNTKAQLAQFRENQNTEQIAIADKQDMLGREDVVTIMTELKLEAVEYTETEALLIATEALLMEMVGRVVHPCGWCFLSDTATCVVIERHKYVSIIIREMEIVVMTHEDEDYNFVGEHRTEEAIITYFNTIHSKFISNRKCGLFIIKASCAIISGSSVL